MSDVVIEKGGDGKLRGLGDKGGRAYARFLSQVRGMAVGDTMRFAFWVPRSLGFHRRHFKIIAKVFENQDQFQDIEKFREWLQVGAGFCDIYPGPKGKPVAIARSIAWERLEEADFEEHHREVIRFMRSAHCTRFLWPQMSDINADTFINNVLGEFGA